MNSSMYSNPSIPRSIDNTERGALALIRGRPFPEGHRDWRLGYIFEKCFRNLSAFILLLKGNFWCLDSFGSQLRFVIEFEPKYRDFN